MGRRTEQRIAVRVPILVHGVDRQGFPFTVTAQTRDISGSGACVTGLHGVATLGSKVEVEYRGRKAVFRIQWLGQEGTSRDGIVGLRSMEPGKYIWDAPLPAWARDDYDPSNPVSPAEESSVGAPSPWSGKDRRKYPRHPCRIEALVTIEDSAIRLPGKVSDISIAGCYVEMLSPLPVDTIVELTLNPGDTTVHALGKVRTCQMGLGMGIAFTAVSPEDFEKLRRIAPPVTEIRKPAGTGLRPVPVSSDSGPPRSPAESPASWVSGPRTTAAPSALPERPSSAAEAIEAVVRALLRKGILSREDLDQELAILKSARR